MQEHIHVRRAHLQSNVWQHVLDTQHVLLEPTSLGWSHGENNELIPNLHVAQVSLAPESVLQLIKCGCVKSMCMCREHNVQCTELCACEADPESCQNVDSTPSDESDTDDEVA